MIKILTPEEVNEEFMLRADKDVAKAEKAAKGVIADVKTLGDKAVLQYTAKFDNIQLRAMEVSKQEFIIICQ